MTAATWNLGLFFEQADTAPSQVTKPTDLLQNERGSRRILICGACRHPVTQARMRIAVNGSHDHRFFNPYGIVFHIGCFGAAPGCVTEGDASTEFAWFKGHVWRLAHCRGCQTHLGWQFSRDGASFYGLVLNRLDSIDDDSPAS